MVLVTRGTFCLRIEWHPFNTPGSIRWVIRFLAKARQGLKLWSLRQWLVALAGGLGSALLLGLATVLIPNPVFGRDIAPVWWNYPVWLLTTALMGMLLATYFADSGLGSRRERRTTRFGMMGSALAWFAVGCPVCNKIALLALGYSGAIAWFAPVQPLLGVLAVLLTGGALVVRLGGAVECPVDPGLTK